MNASSGTRSLALEVLRRIDEDGAYANLALGAALDRSALDRRDRAFCTDLVYGTTRMRRACDLLIDRFLHDDVEPVVRRVLRLGAYQLRWGGVPPHAAVSATVDTATEVRIELVAEDGAVTLLKEGVPVAAGVYF